MSKDLLKLSLKQPEKVASTLAKTLVNSAGAGLGAAGSFKLLSMLRPELAEAALWGGVGAGGVLGHDAAKYLTNKKLAAWVKKRAAMEKPFRGEYSLTKKASIARKLTDVAYKGGLKSPSLATQATYGLLRGGPELGAAISGGIGGKLLAGKLAPHIGVPGFYAADTLPEILANLALGTGGVYAGYSLGSRLGGAVGKGLSRKLMPETARYMRIADPYKLASFTKKAGLSRAAKGAIGLPLGVMGAAALAPGHLFGDIGHLVAGGKLADPTAMQKVVEVLAGTGSKMAFNPHMSTDASVLLGLGGLSALGTGVGKLSERFVPVAKKSITDNPTSRKAALAAAFFPWSLAAAGGGYLYGKYSDS